MTEHTKLNSATHRNEARTVTHNGRAAHLTGTSTFTGTARNLIPIAATPSRSRQLQRRLKKPKKLSVPTEAWRGQEPAKPSLERGVVAFSTVRSRVLVLGEEPIN